MLALAAASICEQVPQADPQALTDRLAESPPEAAGDLIYEVVDWRTTIGDVRRDLRKFISSLSDRIRDAFGGPTKERESESECDDTESSADAKPSGKPPPRPSDK